MRNVENTGVVGNIGDVGNIGGVGNAGEPVETLERLGKAGNISVLLWSARWENVSYFDKRLRTIDPFSDRLLNWRRSPGLSSPNSVEQANVYQI